MRWLRLAWLLIVALCFYGVVTTSGIHWLALSNATRAWRRTSDCVQASKIALLAEVQKKACKEHLDVMPFLSDIATKVKSFCQNLFAGHRWNCASIRLAPKFSNDLVKGTREQAFVYALSSASITHTIAKSCSNAKLKSCGCSELPQEPPPSSFKWGGCGDNIRHGIYIAKAFLETPFDRRKFKRNVTVRVNRHNCRAGWRVIRKSRTIRCKCHGVSGACSSKTCWYSLASLKEIASKLQMKYEEAGEVEQKRISGGMRFRLFSKLPSYRFNKDDLIYFMKSPDYCETNPAEGSYGTKGRSCNATSYHVGSCLYMCCGRGYNLTKAAYHKQCHCKHHWCCYVTCDVCTYEESRHYCL